ncbi:unnamed protein product [Lymnaea stagnalis]|uniref:BTB domain-containing protein n=1 Tax=Lymnaea stagnalis TaxID=6523 RepID=A0AAV2HLB2_LYMST
MEFTSSIESASPKTGMSETVACAIIEGISSVREDEELQDFVVEVEGKEFKCHRLILSACSGFFRGLLRSGMKESKEQRTKLEGFSEEIFKAILDSLYTGNGNLTQNNMLSVWIAVDHLQIPFLCKLCTDFIEANISVENVLPVWQVAKQMQSLIVVETCETFVKRNTSIENCEQIYVTARLLGCDSVVSHVREFVKANYDAVTKSDVLYCLTENDLLEVIESQDLIVSSEDVVVESILTWVKVRNYQVKNEREDVFKKRRSQHSGFYSKEIHTIGLDTIGSDQNDVQKNFRVSNKAFRKEALHDMVKSVLDSIIKSTSPASEVDSETLRLKNPARLLSATRLCLVTSGCLKTLSRDPLIRSNKESTQLVMDAALYQSIGGRHGQWPNAAIHRHYSDFVNVGVMAHRSGKFLALSSCDAKFKLKKMPISPFMNSCISVHLISYLTDLYAVKEYCGNSVLYVFAKDLWREVTTIHGTGWLGVAHEEYMYLFNSSNQKVKRIDPKQLNTCLEDVTCFPGTTAVVNACSLDVSVLAFCSEMINGLEETAVYSLDTRSQTWTRLDNMNGPAEHVVVFKQGAVIYLLQQNGNLWEIQRNEGKAVIIKFVEVLWDFRYKLYGAIALHDKLYIFGGDKAAKPSHKQWPTSSKSFSGIKIAGSLLKWSNIVPAVLHKSILTPVSSMAAST